MNMRTRRDVRRNTSSVLSVEVDASLACAAEENVSHRSSCNTWHVSSAVALIFLFHANSGVLIEWMGVCVWLQACAIVCLHARKHEPGPFVLRHFRAIPTGQRQLGACRRSRCLLDRRRETAAKVLPPSYPPPGE